MAREEFQGGLHSSHNNALNRHLADNHHKLILTTKLRLLQRNERICSKLTCNHPHSKHVFCISISTYLYPLYIQVSKGQWLKSLANVYALPLTGYVYMHQIVDYDSCWVWLNALHLVRPEIFDKDCPVVSNGGKKQVLKDCAQSHIHNVDQYFASSNVVISLQIICLPLERLLHFHTLQHYFPLSANCPQFHRSLPIRPGNYRYGHTSNPLQRNNQHAVCAACGHTAPKLSPGSLSKTITPLAWAFYTSNLEAQEGFRLWRSSHMCCSLVANDHGFFFWHCCR